MVLSIAVPNKGRLSARAIGILNKIGFGIPEDPGRTLMMAIGKGRYKILFARADDIPEFVETGVVDLGITGLDIVMETGRDVGLRMPLDFGKCRLVLAAPDKASFKEPRDVPNGARVATSFPMLTKEYFAKLGINVEVVRMKGATESAPQIGVADLIADITETGSTLKLNHLMEIGTVLESQAVLIANKKSLDEKANAIEEARSAIASVLNARRKRYVMANVPKGALDDLPSLLPGISGPTVMNIIGRDDVAAVHAVVGDDEVNAIVALLKMNGATGILVLPIERLIP